MRRILLLLAAGAGGSVTVGFIGVGLGMSEGVFFAFATIAMALAGLALLVVEHITVAREKAEEPEIIFLRHGITTRERALRQALEISRRRVQSGISAENQECST